MADVQSDQFRGSQLTSADKPRAEAAETVDTTDKKESRHKSGDKNGYVVIDSRGGISVDLERLLSTERGKRSIEKLRRVPVEHDSGEEHTGENGAENSRENTAEHGNDRDADRHDADRH